MNPFAACVDIADLKGQGFFQPKPHGVGGQQKNTIPELAGFPDEGFDFGGSKNVRYGMDFWRFDDMNPLPIALEYMPPKELQAVAIYFNGAP